MRYLHWILIFTGLEAQLAAAQDPRADLIRLIQQSAAPDRLVSMHILICYYPHHSSTVRIDTMSLRAYIQGNYFSYLIKDHEFINNERYSLAINNSAKEIFVSRSKSRGSLPFSLQQADSLLKKTSASVQALGILNGCIGYQILFPRGEIESAECWFNCETSQPAKLIIYYTGKELDGEHQEPRVEAIYTNLKTEIKKQPAAIFSEGRFFINDGNQLRTTDQYKGFTVFNNLY